MKICKFAVAPIGLLAGQALAQSSIADYVAHDVYIGRFDSGYGVSEVYQDLNQPYNADGGFIAAAITGSVPSAEFYNHFVPASDRVPPTNGDLMPTHFDELILIDCDKRLAKAGHAVYYNAENQWVADHDYGGAAYPITANSVDFVVAQKICGAAR